MTQTGGCGWVGTKRRVNNFKSEPQTCYTKVSRVGYHDFCFSSVGYLGFCFSLTAIVSKSFGKMLRTDFAKNQLSNSNRERKAEALPGSSLRLTFLHLNPVAYALAFL